MQVSVESGEGLQRHILVDIPAEQVSQAIEEKLAELATQVRLDGFRPGKAPLRVVRQRFGAQVRQDVQADLLQSSLYEAVKQQELPLVGEPEIEINEASEKGGFAYKATFERLPDVVLADLSGKQMQLPVAEISDADVDDMIQKMREQRATLEDVERAAQDGDTLFIDFTGTIDGERFEGGEGQNAELKLGSGLMIEGFESGLLGVKAGEERTVEAIFPSDYRAEKLAGKQASFVVQVKRVTETHLPEIDSAFNQSYGVDEPTEEALRVEVRKNLQMELQQKLKSLRKDRALDLLRAANPLEIPQALINTEAERMKQSRADNMQGYLRKFATKMPIDLFVEGAEMRVHLGLLSQEIIKQQALEATEDDLRTTIAGFVDSYQDPDEVFDFYLNDAKERANLKNLVLENKVVDWVVSQVEVQDEQTTFSALMAPPEPTETESE